MISAGATCNLQRTCQRHRLTTTNPIENFHQNLYRIASLNNEVVGLN